MTDSEAIQIMDGSTREDFLYMYDAEDRPYLIASAENIALNALKEIQTYRKENLTSQEVLDMMCDLEGAKSVIEEFESIGTVEEFRALKDKEEPKKPLFVGRNWYRCPNGCEVHRKMFKKDLYCTNCGQRLKDVEMKKQ